MRKAISVVFIIQLILLGINSSAQSIVDFGKTTILPNSDLH